MQNFISSFLSRALQTIIPNLQTNLNLDASPLPNIDRPDVAKGMLTDQQAAAHEAGHALIALEDNHRIIYASIVDMHKERNFGKQVYIKTGKNAALFQSGGAAGLIYYNLAVSKISIKELDFEQYNRGQVGTAIDYEKFLAESRDVPSAWYELAFCMKVMQSLLIIERDAVAFSALVEHLSNEKVLSGSNIKLVKARKPIDKNINEEFTSRFAKNGRYDDNHTSVVD